MTGRVINFVVYVVTALVAQLLFKNFVVSLLAGALAATVVVVVLRQRRSKLLRS